jgi:hypothetical protein
MKRPWRVIVVCALVMSAGVWLAVELSTRATLEDLGDVRAMHYQLAVDHSILEKRVEALEDSLELARQRAANEKR